MLRIALNDAVERDLIPANPAAGSKRLRIRTDARPMPVLTGAQVNALLDGTKHDRLHALWRVLLETGLRLGEAPGLQWADVDFTRELVHVRRALVRPTHGVDWVLETPKSGRTREVPMMATTVETLRWHRTRQDAEKITAGGSYTDHGFVFADERGEPLQSTVVYKYHWRPMLARLARDPVARLPLHGGHADARGGVRDEGHSGDAGARHHCDPGGHLRPPPAGAPAAADAEAGGVSGAHKNK